MALNHEFPVDLPCISVAQPLGEFFLCSIPAELLRQVAYWIPAKIEESQGGILKLLGVQRRMSPDRAKSIGEYIDTAEATFPNTIIVSANFDEEDELEGDESLRWSVHADDKGGLFLRIPSAKKLASVIDGQHRLAGFGYAENPDRQSMQLPCAVFLDLPKPYQANIFATINFNQKRVDKSLAYQLFGYELDERNQQKWPPNLVALFIARVLNAERTSPFRGHVKLALAEISTNRPSDKSESNWVVSIAALVEGIERLVSSKPSQDKHLLLSGKTSLRSGLPLDDAAPLRDLFLASNDRATYRVIEDYFRGIADELWEKRQPGSFITRTVGILACFDILRIALLRGVLTKSDTYEVTRTQFAKAANIDFSDDFFHASGAGRVRIRNAIGRSIGLITLDELRGDRAAHDLEEFLDRQQHDT